MKTQWESVWGTGRFGGFVNLLVAPVDTDEPN